VRSTIPTLALVVAAMAPLAGAGDHPPAPEPSSPDREWRLSIAAGSHNVSWPFRALRPLHPSVLTCVETPVARTRFGEVPLRLSVAGFSDRDFNLDGAILALESGYRFSLPGGLRPEASASLGYMASRDTRTGFRQIDGAWRSVRGDVQSAMVFGAGVSVELTLRGHSWPSGIVLAYRWLVQTPYVRTEEPLMAHGVWSVGATFQIRSGRRQGR
jgi:hypothetical protein